MGLNNEINNINRSIKENQQAAERLQRLSDNRQNKKIILQNALLSGILGALEDGANVYESYVIDNIIIESIKGADIESNDIIKEYAQNIYYSTVKKAETIRKKESPKQNELTAYQIEQLRLAHERLEMQKQKIQYQQMVNDEKIQQSERRKTEQMQEKKKAESKKAIKEIFHIVSTVLLIPIFVLWGILEAVAKSK